MDQTIDTSLLIISDTHAGEMIAERLLNLEDEVDVAIHCGDLTDGSKLDEYRSALHLLMGVKAQLKLLIAGNHDFAMDDIAFEHQTKEYVDREARNNSIHAHVVQAELDGNYGARGEAKAMFESAEAKAAGIVFLDEGTHHFTLANGADLHVYASPYTCLESADMGFQYRPDQEHSSDISNDMDIVITHSPPRGVLDRLDQERRSSGARAGSESLFTAVAQARPKMHCFGHIHESWGAKAVAWNDDIPEGQPLTRVNAINNSESTTLHSPSDIRAAEGENLPTCKIELDSFEVGRQTLFVNAALADHDQPVFIVNVPLVEAKSRAGPAIETAQPHAEKRNRDECGQETTPSTRRTCWC